MENGSLLLTECIDYLKERKVFDRLLRKMRDKYMSLGRFGGAVTLYGLGREDWQQLGGFFQKDFSGKQTATISAAAMEKALENSRFAGLDWEDILRGYFGGELISRREQENAELQKRERYFSAILDQAEDGPGRNWLSQIFRTRGEGYLLLVKHYKEDPEYLRKVLEQVLHAADRLPFLTGRKGRGGVGAVSGDRLSGGMQSDGLQPDASRQAGTEAANDRCEQMLVAVFAANMTGDPHFFDSGTLGEQLLTAFLKAALPGAESGRKLSTEDKAALFYDAGLLKDDLSNHTLTYGIGAWTKDGRKHEGVEAFRLRKEPLVLTLMNLGSLSRAEAAEKKVYIVENPAVFSVLVREWSDAAVICGNGQIRLATFALLDLFDRDVIFYYAGDFDPEGLQIAQRLKERYGERLRLWNYRKEYYEAYRSEVEISGQRLKKLDQIYLEELQEIREALLQEKKAAYQEAMMGVYLGDVEKK